MAHRIKKHSAIKTQGFVIRALFKRELITRFGKYKLGMLWMLLDPLLSVIVLGIVLGPFLGRSSGEIPYAFFLLCGFLLLSLMTGPINSGGNAIKSNQGLLVFRQVQPFDAFLSRFIFELFVATFSFLIFCIIGWWIGIEISTSRLFALLACILITWIIGCGLGLVLGVLSLKVKELEKVVTYVQKPLLFVSAVIYPLSAIPPDYREYILYNPLAHTIEYSRSCLFPGYDSGGANLVYPSIFALITISMGMMVYRNNRHFLTQR